MSEVQMLGDVLTVSGELTKLFADHMETGSMPFAISSWVTTRHELPASDKFDIQTTRSLSLLKTIFVTFDSAVTERGADASAQGVWTNSTWLYNPQAGKALTIDADALEWQVVIDSRVWPV